MSTLQTEAQILAQAKAVISKWVNTKVFTDAYVAYHNTIATGVYPDNATPVEQAIDASRALLAGLMSSARLRAELDPILLTYERVLGKPFGNVMDLILNDIYDRFIASGQSVAHRGITFGAVAGGTNHGTGKVNRLYVDENGFTMEAVTPEVKTVLCIADEHSGGVADAETFRFTGAAALPDVLEAGGSGAILSTVQAMSGLQSSRWLTNPSFDTVEGTDAVPTGLTGWTVVDIANVSVVRTAGNYYRGYQGQASPGAAHLIGHASFLQSLRQKAVNLDPNVPCYLQIAVRPTGGADGSLVLQLGSQVTTVLIATLTINVWNVVRLELGTKNWYRNWNMDDPKVFIDWAGRSAGALDLDDVIFCPMVAFGKTWYAVVGGDSPFLLGDNFSFADTEALAYGKIQYWFWRAYGRYLPHTNGVSSTWTDP